MIYYFTGILFALLSVAYRSRFADDGNLHLSWIGHFVLYLFGYFTGQLFGLFVVGGQVYTDNVAPQHLKAQAQGLLSFVVWGVGLLIGNFVCGSLIKSCSVSENGAVVCDWGTVFLITTAMSVAVMLLFLFCFRTEKKVRRA